jgi:hypothetical protein
MSFYVVILVIALTLWGLGLWLRGFFSGRTPPIERKVYWLRTFVWFASILVIAWPLQRFRAQLGTTAYLALALAIIVLFYWLGVVAAKALTKHQETRDSDLSNG